MQGHILTFTVSVLCCCDVIYVPHVKDSLLIHEKRQKKKLCPPDEAEYSN